MKIAAFQGEGVSGNVAKALDLMRAHAVEAARAGAGLVVFPELFLTGYNIADAVFELAEPAVGPSAAKISGIARETGVTMIRPFDIVARTLVPARAFENQVFVAYAGMCGSEAGLGYCGLSCIVGPDGQDLARARTGPALLFADIDRSAISRSRKENPYLTDRHPEIYAAPVKRVRSPSEK